MPSCGNGVIDPGETCDPPASCPASCSDGNACTIDSMTGSAASCDVACSHTAITACAGGDGCCPAGCDANNDNDCSTTCGNGTVEPGETCDPPSSCPVSCDDNQACTIDTQTGSAAGCNTICGHSDVVSCVAGDGCCPLGCSKATDADCAFVCGNGVIDAGETCDPPASCPQACDGGDACTSDSLTGDPDSCTAECKNLPVTSCAGGDGCCPEGCTPETDSDCGAGAGAGGAGGGGDEGDEGDCGCATVGRPEGARPWAILALAALCLRRRRRRARTAGAPKE